jgi:two-component system C4-dicarboxylate transport sensor histidine kinase DctB
MSDSAKIKELLEVVRRHCHELRQPLLGIRGYAEMMAAMPADAALAAEGAAQIAAQADRITRLVNDLADLAGRMSGDPPSQVVPGAAARSTEVSAPVEEAIKLFRYRTGDGVKLSAELPSNLPRVRIAPDHLERIAINLLSNALDATGKSGAVQVRARPGGGKVILEVGDDGGGIPDAVRERLFAPGTTTKGATHGLGLAICRELAREAGGDLVLTTVDDQGPPWPHSVKTVFRLSLPASSD